MTKDQFVASYYKGTLRPYLCADLIRFFGVEWTEDANHMSNGEFLYKYMPEEYKAMPLHAFEVMIQLALGDPRNKRAVE